MFLSLCSTDLSSQNKFSRSVEQECTTCSVTITHPAQEWEINLKNNGIHWKTTRNKAIDSFLILC